MGVDTYIIEKLEAKIDSLTKQIYFKDRQIRELTSEITDCKLREQKFSDALSYRFDDVSPKIIKIDAPNLESADLDTFLNPKLDVSPKSATEFCDYSAMTDEFIFIYTEELFVEHECPDCFLYLDDRNSCYRSLDGLVRLSTPINPEDVRKFNILKIRVASEKEIGEILLNFDI